VLARVASTEHPGQNTASPDSRADQIRRLGERGAGTAASLKTLTDALAASDENVREAAVWSLTQWGKAASPAVPALTRALGDVDPVVRGLSAVALRDAGRAASAPALDTLISHLADPDENVRMMTAQAISTQGPEAKRAMPELMKACQVEGQHPHVLRSLADALGLIGPDAKDALPVLRDLTKIPRVRWAAELAIKRIEAH
jgi:HEAT repeat protein